MKTIAEHEAEDRPPRRYSYAPCGIECPKCGKELWSDSSIVEQKMSAPGFEALGEFLMDTASPPKKRAHCHKCNWTGSVTA